MSQEKLRVTFAPGALESLENEMTPEELQAFMDELQQKIESGSLFEDSTEVDLTELERTDPEIYAALMLQLEADHTPPTLN